jgi:hypothetical protein
MLFPEGGYLISVDVPFTIASEDELLGPVAIAFSSGFYRSLARGSDVSAAYLEAVSSCIMHWNVYYPEEIAFEGYSKCEGSYWGA